MKKLRLIKTTLTTLLITACVGTGLVTVDDEKQAGSEVAQQVEEQVGLYPAAFLTSYVDAVGRRLVASLDSSPYYFRFSIIDQGEPNAFAAPGGYIYVSRGLMALINTEDELAGILAHEIIHVTQRHHARQAQRTVLPGILTLPGRAIGKVVGQDIGNTINAPIEAAGGAYVASYGRDQESEADRLGMQLAARAGYDPAALANALYNLERTVTLLTDDQHAASFFDSHPTTPSRIADIKRNAENITWTSAQPFAQNREALLDRLDGLFWGIDNPVQGIFREQQFMHPDMDFSITFPDGWKAVNTPVFVGAFAPGNQALVILGGPERPGSAIELATSFIEELRAEADLEPAEARPIKLDAGPAYLVRIEDISGDQPTSIYYLWVNARNTTFRFIAAGADSFRDQLRDTVLSLRTLTDEEKASIFFDRIRSVTARNGESMREFSVRSENHFSPELTAAVNGLPEESTLEQDQLIKILQRTPYLRRAGN
jgi:predicted Zn-dependent protease